MYVTIIRCILFSAKMTVSVAVCSDYPRTPPVFAVNIHWKTDRSSLNDSNVRVGALPLCFKYLTLCSVRLQTKSPNS